MKYDTEQFTQHLMGMIRFPTVSTVDPSELPLEAFHGLQAYLEKTYPLTFQTLEKEIIGKCALLLHWKGTGKSDKLPLLVMAHQDVVPVGDWKEWHHPPFEPYLDEKGILWGRGACDCKNIITFELEAIEGLIADGFVPDHDIYAIYGYNEEIMGGEGAACRIIVDELKKRGIRFGLLLDEGWGVLEANGCKTGNVNVCEKGYADFEFSVEQPGGHSAMPPKHNALGELSHALWLLEENPMEPFQSVTSVKMFKALAPFTPGRLGEVFKDPENNWDELVELCSQVPKLNAAIRTTITPTMSSGSLQANVLPLKATAVANCRILPGQTIEDLEAHFRKVLPEHVKFRLLKGNNPPPFSPDNNWAFRLVERVTKKVNGEDAVCIPNLALGGTDARYYTEICENAYRYSGGKNSVNSGGGHMVNEHLDTAVMASNVEFFYRLIQNYGDAK